MQVFISYARAEKEFAKKLEDALRSHEFETWSDMDLAPGENWRKALEQASAKADGFIFVLGSNSSQDPRMWEECLSAVRNDWESKKPFIPILPSHLPEEDAIPPFLRDRQLLIGSDSDELVNRVVDLLKNPAKTRIRRLDEEGRKEQTHRLDELRTFALALKKWRSEGKYT